MINEQVWGSIGLQVNACSISCEIYLILTTIFRRMNAPAWINGPPDFWLWLAISQKLLERSDSYFHHLKYRYSRVEDMGSFSASAPGAFIRQNTVLAITDIKVIDWQIPRFGHILTCVNRLIAVQRYLKILRLVASWLTLPYSRNDTLSAYLS